MTQNRQLIGVTVFTCQNRFGTQVICQRQAKDMVKVQKNKVRQDTRRMMDCYTHGTDAKWHRVRVTDIYTRRVRIARVRHNQWRRGRQSRRQEQTRAGSVVEHETQDE